MTENRRILLNIVATYIRSLYGLLLGLLCGRWALMALGEVDYGLNGLVGGLMIFISFFNGILAGANARFYAISIGAVKTADDKAGAIEECRKWFNTALTVHTIVPLVLIVVGYPIGIYAVEHWLTIPSERVADCVWVFRFVCVSCLVGMINVPFSAMYGAKQHIAELTVYSFVTSTLNVLVLGYMISHPGTWLSIYAACTCILSVIPQIIICIRALMIFPECKIVKRYLCDRSHIKQLGVYSLWQFIGAFCGMLRNNGIAIVVNKFFGATMNAAQAIGNNVQGQCNLLASAMQSAFVPVITQACGAGDYERMNKFVIRTCKFNVMLSLIFMIPLALELPEVMRLWLKNPPAFSTGLCYCAMLLHLSNCCTVGHMVAVNATGKVAKYYLVLGGINIFDIPCAVVAGWLFRSVYAVMGVVIFFEGVNSIGRIYFARNFAKSSLRAWIRSVVVPTSLVVLLTLPVGYSTRVVLPASFVRVAVTTLVCELVLFPIIWHVVLNGEERVYLKERISAKFSKLWMRVTNK